MTAQSRFLFLAHYHRVSGQSTCSDAHLIAHRPDSDEGSQPVLGHFRDCATGFLENCVVAAARRDPCQSYTAPPRRSRSSSFLFQITSERVFTTHTHKQANMGCASSSSRDDSTASNKRRPYVDDGTPKPKGAMFRYPHAKVATFPREAQTARNALACRQRFEEHSDELDREALSSLAWTRSSCCSQCSQNTSGSTSMVAAEDERLPTQKDGCSLAQLFGALEAPASCVNPGTAAPPSVFDLINSDEGSDVGSAASDAAGCGDGVVAMPPAHKLEHALLLHVPDLIDNDDGDCAGGHCAEAIPRGCHPLADAPGISPVPSSVASSTGSRRSKASTMSPVLNSLRAKLLRPGSPLCSTSS